MINSIKDKREKRSKEITNQRTHTKSQFEQIQIQQ